MNRKVWELDYFTDSHPTCWKCAHCFTGSLFPVAQPSVNRNDRFAIHFQCSNIHCNQEYACIGAVQYFSSANGTAVSQAYKGPQYVQFYPERFSPTLRLFPLHPSIPEPVIACLNTSFDTFWSDYASSANALRRALEKLLNEAKIPAGKNLHRRIECFKSSSPELAKLFAAIKWIGNHGSHGEQLIKKDLLDAYVIFEHCLGELFPSGDKAAAVRLANEINARDTSWIKA